MAPRFAGKWKQTTTITVRTEVEAVEELERLCSALAGSAYAEAGQLSRARVADLALRRGIESLRREVEGAEAPAVQAAALPAPDVVERARAALEALARLPVEKLEALAANLNAAPKRSRGSREP
jgi:hypothetical protein